MNKLKWYFPKTLKEAYLLKCENEKAVYHSGGTAIRRAGFPGNCDCVIDTSKLPFGFFKLDDKVTIGAGFSFSETITSLKETNCCPLLKEALSLAATTPLRNRITIGGSIGAMHVWSDLLGPLLVLDADITFYQNELKTVKLETFLNDRNLRENSIIKEISFSTVEDKHFYYRETRTKVDYPAFTISILKSGDTVLISLTGSKNRFERLKELENYINKGKDFQNCLDTLDLSFSNKPHGSADYLKEVAKVEIERGLRSVGL